MHRQRPTRLHGFDYTGLQRYHLRFATGRRQPLFTRAEVARAALAQIQRVCTSEEFGILAYCLMPDHVHLVLQGASPDADLRRCAMLSKQATGYQLRRLFSLTDVWQVGYFERVLRDDEPTEVAVRYVLNNPGSRQTGHARRGLSVQRGDDVARLAKACRATQGKAEALPRFSG